MAGIALKGQCDLVSTIVSPKVSIKEKVFIEGTKNVGNLHQLHANLQTPKEKKTLLNAD